MPDKPEVRQPTRAELDEAEAYLQRLHLPADEWLLDNPQQHYLVTQVTGKLFGLDEDSVRGAAARGEFPGSVLPNQRTGWRIDRNGLIWYVAERRRAAAQRASQTQQAG